MKFLKRLGKKIKKGLKKIMGSKIGRIVGMIGLSMAMGAVAKQLIGKFGAQAAAGATEAVAATEAATAAQGIETAAKATEALQAAGGAAELGAASTSAGVGQLGTAGTTAGGTGPVIDTITSASTNAEAASAGISHLETSSVASNGMVNPDALKVSNSITEAVENVNNTFFDSSYQPSMASDKLFATPPASDGSLMGYQPGTYETFTTTPTPSPVAETTSLLDPTDFSNLKEGASITDVYPETGRGEWWKTRADAAAKDLKQGPYTPSLGERIKDFGSNVVAGMNTPAEIASKVVQGTLTGAALNVIAGDPEEPFYSKGVSPRLESVGPQAAYIQDIEPSFRAATNIDVMPTFQQLQKSALFGTGTLDFLNTASNNTPLLFPSMLNLSPLSSYNKRLGVI